MQYVLLLFKIFCFEVGALCQCVCVCLCMCVRACVRARDVRVRVGCARARVCSRACVCVFSFPLRVSSWFLYAMLYN